MDCQKKSEHMIDRIGRFALGEIATNSEPGLLAHVAECGPCREAYDEAVAVRALMDRGMEKLVTGQPSPQFNFHLRARIAREPLPSRGNWNFARLWVPAIRWPWSSVAGTAILVAILVLAMLRSPRTEQPTPLVAIAPARLSAPPNPATVLRQASANLERRHLTPASHTFSSLQTNPEPEVLVPKEELRAVARFYESTRTGPVRSSQLYAVRPPTDEPLEWKPIEITPLEPAAEILPPDSHSGPGLF
jgi:hypothetical protein